MKGPEGSKDLKLCEGNTTHGGAKPEVFLMTDTLQTGGSEHQFAVLARALNSDRFAIRLGCLERKGAFLKDLPDITEFDLGRSFFTWRAQRARLALARHLRAERTLIAHSFDFYSNLMLIPTARLAGVPIVIGSQRQLGDLLSPAKAHAQAIAFGLCDRIVCNSRAAAKRLIDQGFPDRKLAMIPNGLPDTAFSKTPPSLPPSPGSLRVGFIARMNDTVKNHAGFLRAAARLAQRLPMVEFLLVGDGPLRPGLELLARDLGLSPKARFLGERHDIPGLLAAMDVSVIFSSSESLSNVVLESMAAGIPVVATRVGGNPEVVRDGETGFLVESGNEDQLMVALRTLLERPELRSEFGQHAKRLAWSSFRLDEATRQYEELYTALLKEKDLLQERSAGLAVSSPSQPLRVAIVAASPRWIGGQGVQAELLMRHWRKDPAVDARFIPIDPQMPRMLRWVERIPLLRTLVRTPFYLAALWRGMGDVDLAHIFSASYWSFLVAPMPAWLVARFRRKKTLIHYHSGEAQDHLRRSGTAVGVLRRADRLVVPSNYLVHVFRKFGLQTQVVPNFVDLSQFTYRRLPQVQPSLVNTRGFHPYYSIDLVIRAFARVQQKFPEATLCLAGNGPLEGRIRLLARELKLNGIEFAGPVPQAAIHDLYTQADIFINASWLDNAPVSILEAFASGTPVVTTAPEGIRYMVEHERTGLLCAPGDWPALAENALRLLREPQLASRLAQNAYEEVQSNSWGRVRSRWLQVYESMCRQVIQDGSPQQPASHLTALANRDNQAIAQNFKKTAASGWMQC